MLIKIKTDTKKRNILNLEKKMRIGRENLKHLIMKSKKIRNSKMPL